MGQGFNLVNLVLTTGDEPIFGVFGNAHVENVTNALIRYWGFEVVAHEVAVEEGPQTHFRDVSHRVATWYPDADFLGVF